MGDLIHLHTVRHTTRVFTQDEAEAILPAVKRITERASSEARDVEAQLRFVPTDEPLSARLKAQHDLIIKRWAMKVGRLGCEPRGVWLVDFNANEGSYVWRLGDNSLSYFHSSDVGRPLSDPAFPEFPSS